MNREINVHFPGPRVFTFEQDPTWCGEPAWVFSSPPEKLVFYRPRGWLYEWNDFYSYPPFRIILDDGPRPRETTLLILDLRQRLPEMPDALRAIGIAAVVQLDALVSHITSTAPRLR